MQGHVAGLTTVLPNLVFLGLSNNMLGSWEHVHQIAASLTNLQTLDVSFNRLRFMHCPDKLRACEHLRTLVANGCELTWQHVVLLSSTFTDLEELYLGSNVIDRLENNVTVRKPHCFKKLRVLDITDNHIKGWEAALHVSTLSMLSCLKLSGNILHAINLPGSAPFTPVCIGLVRWLSLARVHARSYHVLLQFAGDALQNIYTLLLANCGISDWASINALACLPQLRELRLTGNPVLHLSSLSGRNECIARLAAITQLNGAGISAHERRDCELQYLYRVQQRIVDLGSAGLAEAELHPRLEELCALHGNMAIQPRQSHIAADAALGQRLVALDLVYTGMQHPANYQQWQELCV